MKHLLLAVLTIGLLFDLSGGSIVYASDQPVKDEIEPDGAVHGEAKLQALLYKNLKYPIQLDLYPEFEDGIHYSFVLSEENDYTLKEELMVGSYCVTAGIATDKDITKINVRAAVTPNVVIKENSESTPVVVALEGTQEFVQDYQWLTTYKDEVDGYLSGSITEEEAKAYYEKDIESQHKNMDYTDTDGEIDYSVQEKDEDEKEEIAEFEPEEDTKSASVSKKIKPFVWGIAAISFLVIIAVLIRKRRGK